MERYPKHWPQRRLPTGIWMLTVTCLTLSVQAEDKQQKPVQTARQSTPTAQAPPTFYPALTRGETRIEEELNKDSEANFPKVPLSETMTYFSALHNIPIQIQKQDLEDAGVSVDELIDVHLEEISLQNELDYILKPLNLTYVVDGDMLLITSRQKADQMFQTRVYPVGDLCNSGPDDYAALETVIRTARLGRWSPVAREQHSSGYPAPRNKAGSSALNWMGGTISEHPQSQSLVITQTYQAHKAIARLLEDLRKARAAQQKPVHLKASKQEAGRGEQPAS